MCSGVEVLTHDLWLQTDISYYCDWLCRAGLRDWTAFRWWFSE